MDISKADAGNCPDETGILPLENGKKLAGKISLLDSNYF